MKILLLRNEKNQPYTIWVKGHFRKRFYQVVDAYGVFELPRINTPKDKA